MSEQKDKEKSRQFAFLFGAKNQCYGNCLETLKAIARGKSNAAWFYVEGIIRGSPEDGGVHHGWLSNGSIVDPTEPYADLIYCELRRWPAAEFLTIAAEDIELPLTHENGELRPQGPE